VLYAPIANAVAIANGVSYTPYIMGIRERREREREEMRRKILDGARALFLSQGVESVSMRKIAETIEYSPTAIYDYFEDKEDLLRELCRCDFGTLTESFAAIASIPDPIERLAALAHGYIGFALKYPNHYRMMFMTSYEHPPLEEDDLSRKGDPDQDSYGLLLSSVEHAIKEGRFAPGWNDRDLAAQTLWAGVHGVASLAIAKANDPWIDWARIEARTSAMVDVLLFGMTGGDWKTLKKKGLS
jgi:AcrR family transcriptional regulator